MGDLFTGQSYDQKNFFLIAGPCVVENEDMVMEIAEKVYDLCKKFRIPYIFKASYRKANRTSAGSFTGIGDEKALVLIQNAGKKFGLPVTTDIHAPAEAAMAAAYTDVLQIPAFLCRQSDLLETAAQTGKIVNVKKRNISSGGQFHEVSRVEKDPPKAGN